MVEPQSIETIEAASLIDRVRLFFDGGHRLVQIGCTVKEDYELTYSFDRGDYQLIHLRVHVPLAAPDIPSISGVYLCAFPYENELHDLFGLNVTGICVDFKGHFYKLAAPTPFKPVAGVPIQPVTAPPSSQEGV